MHDHHITHHLHHHHNTRGNFDMEHDHDHEARHKHEARHEHEHEHEHDPDPGRGRGRWSLMASLAEDERLHLAVVLEGDSVGVMAQRAVARAVLRTNRRQIYGTIADAVRPLLGAIGGLGTQSELVAFVESLRAKL